MSDKEHDKKSLNIFVAKLLKEIRITSEVSYMTMDIHISLRQIANCLTFEILRDELMKDE